MESERNKQKGTEKIMKNTKLPSMPYASAHVNYNNDGSIDLISYVTRVITVTADGWMDCTGTYSATTRKHISAFMRDIVAPLSGHPLTYYTAKECYEKGLCMNIHTGEVVPV
jgi:hypothetical protein